MRLVNLKKNTLSDNQLLKYHKKDSLVYNKFNKAIDPIISTGIKIGIDLKSSNNICAYKAKKNAHNKKINVPGKLIQTNIEEILTKKIMVIINNSDCNIFIK